MTILNFTILFRVKIYQKSGDYDMIFNLLHNANRPVYPTYWDRGTSANSVDPHQTAPNGAVWSRSTLFAVDNSPISYKQ